MQHHHSYAAQKNNKAHNPHKRKRANRDRRGGDPKQPVGLRYSKNQIDDKNGNTFEALTSPVREEVGEFRDGCFVLDDSSARPSNCIELARPKLKTTAKDLKIRDFKDGYFELRTDEPAAMPAPAGTGDVRSASAPVLLTPDHFRSQSSNPSNSALYSSQSRSTAAAELPPAHRVAHQPLHQFSAPRLISVSQPMGIPMPSSSVPNMYYYQAPMMQRRPPPQQAMQFKPTPVQPAPFSFQSFAQGVAASTAHFRPPPTHQVVHASDLAPKTSTSSKPLSIPTSGSRAKSPEKRTSSPPVAHEKWAGGGYSNSPHPSLLPAPVF